MHPAAQAWSAGVFSTRLHARGFAVAREVRLVSSSFLGYTLSWQQVGSNLQAGPNARARRGPGVLSGFLNTLVWAGLLSLDGGGSAPAVPSASRWPSAKAFLAARRPLDGRV
jgi:hypothetical protein